MDEMKHRRLQELDRSDFEIVDNDPDIRGWDVKNEQGKKIGEVEELIIDAQLKKVRYMVVELDDDDLDLKDDRKVLIPIGLAELDREDDDVILSGVTVQQLNALPAYHRDVLTQETERQICTALGRSGSMNFTAVEDHNAEFYKHEHFNEDRLFKNRMHEDKNTTGQDSDYEKGLRLWELRSRGGIIDDQSKRSERRESSGDESYHEREVSEEARMEMVKNRRSNYEQRRSVEGRRSERPHRDNSIERRIRDEGLRDG